MDEALRRLAKQLRLLLSQGGEVQTGTSQEILGLTNVHPETLQVKGVQLTVADNGGEGLLLDRGRAVLLDAAEDRSVEHVDTGIDAVADELDGLLDEAVDAGGVVRLVDDDTVLGGLLNLGDNNSALLAVSLVEVGKLLEGEFAGDIGVENEEGLVVLSQDLLSELQRTSRAEGLGLK